MLSNILKEHSYSLKLYQKNKKQEEKKKNLKRVFNFERATRFELERIN